MSNLFLDSVQGNLILEGLKLFVCQFTLPIFAQVTHGGTAPYQKVYGSLLRPLAEILYGISLLPEGEGPTIVFSQHLEESSYILGIPRIKTENPVKHIRGISCQRRYHQGHEIRILIIIMIVGDTAGLLPKDVSHIMRMTLLTPKFGNLDLTRKSILFLMPPPGGASSIGVTTTPATLTSSAPTPPVGGPI